MQEQIVNRKSEIVNQIELVLVRVAHRPFGLLMSQIYNIVRPETQSFKVKTYPDEQVGREWGEIEYRGSTSILKVLELARVLKLPLVEPIERSQILLTGKAQATGVISQPFGVACDDILSIITLPLDDLRPMPFWLFKKRLGKLIWSAALIERKLLVGQVEPAEFDLDNDLLGENQAKDSLEELGLIFTPSLAPYKPEISLRREASKPKDERQPVMLLDLDVLRRRIYDT
jgi:chemotaxis signal transduction protein